MRKSSNLNIKNGSKAITCAWMQNLTLWPFLQILQNACSYLNAIPSWNKKFPSSQWSQALNAVKALSWGVLVRKPLNNQEATLCFLNGMRLYKVETGGQKFQKTTLFLTTCFKWPENWWGNISISAFQNNVDENC